MLAKCLNSSGHADSPFWKYRFTVLLTWSSNILAICSNWSKYVGSLCISNVLIMSHSLLPCFSCVASELMRERSSCLYVGCVWGFFGSLVFAFVIIVFCRVLGSGRLLNFEAGPSMKVLKFQWNLQMMRTLIKNIERCLQSESFRYLEGVLNSCY